MKRWWVFAGGALCGAMVAAALTQPLQADNSPSSDTRIAALEARLTALESGTPPRDRLSFDVRRDMSLNAAKTLTLTAGDQITIKTGKASLTMKKDGTIVLKGEALTLDGDPINVKGTGDLTIKGSQIREN